jgi:hypothetical protein
MRTKQLSKPFKRRLNIAHRSEPSLKAGCRLASCLTVKKWVLSNF